MAEAFNSVFPDEVVSLIRRFNSHPVADLVKTKEFRQKRIVHYQNIRSSYKFASKQEAFNWFFQYNIKNKYKKYIITKIAQYNEWSETATHEEKCKDSLNTMMLNLFVDSLRKQGKKAFVSFSDSSEDEEYEY